jgi:hypothetical protein
VRKRSSVPRTPRRRSGRSSQDCSPSRKPRQAIALELSGIGITYPGTTGRAADVPAADDGCAVLIGAVPPEGWAGRVETREGPEPRLVRADGYVVWAGGPGLGEALSRWIGVRNTAGLVALGAAPR